MASAKFEGPQLSPERIIVPIMGLRPEDPYLPTFLGTGAIVGAGDLLLTADHVVREWTGKLGFPSIKPSTGRKQFEMWNLELVERDQLHDLALLRVDPRYHSRGVALRLGFDEPIFTNSSVMSFEYGTTVFEDGRYHLNPATRVGNVTRSMDLTSQLGPAGDEALELSFPALRGASGAPVITMDGGYKVIGVVIANRAYHLLPTQIESVLDEKNNLLEEVRFMMPQAIAVNIQHLRGMYRRATGSASKSL